ncbi:MAG: preprotein translocase subunit SecA [Calditrichaeota bacterium]|nr:MAG: preprotein translocase subunit SecA [Calditrichota bacterium]
MFNAILEKVFGNKHEKDVHKLEPIVAQINEIYETLSNLTDDELKNKTVEFKEKIATATAEVSGEIEKFESLLRDEVADESGKYESSDEIRDLLAEKRDEELEIINEVLDEILPEAFAVVKDACRRLVGTEWDVIGQKTRWDMVPYDVQLIGGIVLHQGKIAEMATGEGKTLVATLPLYLNGLAGKGVHLITVNDYLAQRDCEWMGKVFDFLGLSTAAITNDIDPSRRKVAYAADITYGTNNEFGFDYLRDNMSGSLEDQVQRKHNFAIIDEVDSVLIDEARTPLIISGPVDSSNQQYLEMKPRVEKLVRSQTMHVNKLVAEGEKLLNEGDEEEAGVLLLRASRGAPKNKRLMKLMNEKGVKRLIRGVESDFIRDKRMQEIDEDLYFAIDEKAHTIDLMDKGREALSPNDPQMFVLPDLSQTVHAIEIDENLTDEEKIEKREALNLDYSQKADQLHSISQLLRAYSLFEKDVEYVVSDDNKVMIVDEFTGRLMTGRRYSDGLHQAIEAKEGVKIEKETQTMATITLQNYFRMYSKLAGMTGTAETESSEFWEIYKLDVVVIPTNRPITRIDHEDFVYRTKREKYNAVIGEISDLHNRKRPILVGTTSVDESETLSRMLKRKGVKHNVLNAKQHKSEAEIISNAGQPGAVTIATNMAGRGTDIKLGAGVVVEGEPESGLQIIGTGRHEARRIDRQLRGRSGRQGDPGSSRFFLSLEDDLMRLFQSDRVASVMDRLGLEDGEVITHSMVTKSIERAQKRVEAHNFDIRKHLLEYDNVMNQQREVIYDRRNHALRGENLREDITQIITDQVDLLLEMYLPAESYADDWDLQALRLDFQKMYLADWQLTEDETESLGAAEIGEKIHAAALHAYEDKEKAVTSHIMRQMERFAMLQTIDVKWRDHLYEMDQLKEGIGLRAYGQKDPLIEYKAEGFRAFKEMIESLNREVVELIFKMQIQTEPPPEAQRRQQMIDRMTTVHQDATGMGLSGGQSPQNAPAAGKRRPVHVEQKVGRNDPCPCGSGKKYKKCHGANN